jgi:hypothetical protein
MLAEIRRKLAMAVRARDFAQAHPSTDASYTALVARLQDRLTRADGLAMLQRDGHNGERAAVAHRGALRATIQRVQLRHLVGVAAMAAKDHPDLSGSFVYPDSGGPYHTFITAARSMLAAAAPNKDLFASLGLGDTFLDELTQAVAEFDATTEAAHARRRDHVGARAELATLADECIKLTGLLDGFYRIRFRNDSQSLAEWESSRNVVGPFRPKQQPAPAPTPAPAPAPASAPAPAEAVANPPVQATPPKEAAA